MFNLNLFKNIGVILYLFIYLIIPHSATTQTLKVDFIDQSIAFDKVFVGLTARHDISSALPTAETYDFSVDCMQCNIV